MNQCKFGRRDDVVVQNKEKMIYDLDLDLKMNVCSVCLCKCQALGLVLFFT